MLSKAQVVDYPVPGAPHKWRNADTRELWNAEQPWNWVLLGSVLGCLLFWALVVWGILIVI